ncbi:hypothetical protein QOZ98_000054 [Planomicrobium stackebrandtii]|uniref:Uncharacterized protein n=1 Tax=Planomicrobium stackebrandtii TaxID=253160 RepID=A0ABU0GPE4_9BACL|nr:hypothetical protein [Planomicrobium stackebrandtii]
MSPAILAQYDVGERQCRYCLIGIVLLQLADAENAGLRLSSAVKFTPYFVEIKAFEKRLILSADLRSSKYGRRQESISSLVWVI